MAITPAPERVRKSRRRRRLGLRTVQVEVSEQVINFLLAHKYELERRVDPVIPRCEKCTFVIEAMGGDKVRVNHQSLS